MCRKWGPLHGDGPDWDWYYELVKENWPLALQSLKRFVEKQE